MSVTADIIPVDDKSNPKSKIKKKKPKIIENVSKTEMHIV